MMTRLLLSMLMIYGSCVYAQSTQKTEDTSDVGYRVQIAQTSDREEAHHIRRLATLRFEEEVYLVFEPPYYKVRVGNFDDWGEASATQEVAMQKGFEDAWIVGSKVKRNGATGTKTGRRRRTVADSRHLKGGKFGFFDIEDPAVGLALRLGSVSPHLHLHLDGDLVFSDDTALILDLSLRYLFDRSSHVWPYLGGGPGAALGDHNTLTAHFLGGIDFRIDTVPTFAELKIHLNNPEAVSLWFGLRF